MTITVVTPEHGDRPFDANDWEIVDDGRLWVGNGDVGVAEFNKGAWLFVYETVVSDDPVSDEPRKPRVWHDLRAEVPIRVTVQDRHGDIWRWSTRDGWQCWMDGELDPDINDPERYSPFTEVFE